MKSVLMSIRPQWCEKIASGKKTIEVRKTKPKLETPFKVYIYETKGKLRHCNTCTDNNCEKWYGEGLSCYEGKGKVIGEFVCDKIHHIDADSCLVYLDNQEIFFDELERSCLCMTRKQLLDYSKGKRLYCWNISDLVIYDKPKELSDFFVKGDCPSNKCLRCKYFDKGNGVNVEDDCFLPYEKLDCKPLFRPPQSWCYVEELGE